MGHFGAHFLTIPNASSASKGPKEMAIDFLVEISVDAGFAPLNDVGAV